MYGFNKLLLAKYGSYAQSMAAQSLNKLATHIQGYVPKAVDAYQCLGKMSHMTKVALLVTALTPFLYYLGKKFYPMVSALSTPEYFSSTDQKIKQYFTKALQETERLASSQPQKPKGILHEELFARFAARQKREERVSYFDASCSKPLSREERVVLHCLGTADIHQLMQRSRISQVQRGRV